MDELVFNENEDQFILLRTTNKTVFEFRINTEDKDRFLYLIKVLSSIEFKVDVDLKKLRIRKFLAKASTKKLVFIIRASGKEEDLNRWHDNLRCVAKFLCGEYDITHIKKIAEKDNI